MVPLSEDSKIREKMGREALAQATSMVFIVSILVHLDLYQVTADCLSNDLFLFPFQRAITMMWVHENYDRPLKVAEKRTEYARHLTEKLLEEEGKRKKVED